MHKFLFLKLKYAPERRHCRLGYWQRSIIYFEMIVTDLHPESCFRFVTQKLQIKSLCL
jgi:hypothetical protein